MLGSLGDSPCAAVFPPFSAIRRRFIDMGRRITNRMIIMKRLSRVKRPVHCMLFPSKTRPFRFELCFCPRGEECVIPRRNWWATVSSFSTRCWAFQSGFPSNRCNCKEKRLCFDATPAGNVSCGGEGWKSCHRGSFIVGVVGE